MPERSGMPLGAAWANLSSCPTGLANARPTSTVGASSATSGVGWYREGQGPAVSRIRHAHVPRSQVQGWVTLPGGVPFPYVVMEWVEGTSLYEWGARQPRTSRQVMRVLAQVARALEATHAVEGVHRDVKGDNVRVRAGDGTAVLMDFGAGNFRGAPVLTRQPPPPGTDKYWSPECVRFQMKWLSQPTRRYEAGPADDLYALGVTAYRLVTGVYPSPGVDLVVTEDEPQFIEPEQSPVVAAVESGSRGSVPAPHGVVD
jgi:serine/threonine protein kinase